MSGYLPLDPAFTVEVQKPPPPLAAALEARIEEIWQAERRRLGERLFNGPVLSLVACTPNRLQVRYADYRQLVARRRAPELAAALQLRPLAVTGLFTCHDGVVFGRRAAHLANDPGAWETAPSGGLAHPEPQRQVLEELEEELGLSADQVSPPQAFGMLWAAADGWEEADGVHDILFRLTSPKSGAEIVAAHRNSGSDEYSELAIVPPQRLETFLEDRGGNLVPLVRPLLERGLGLAPKPR